MALAFRTPNGVTTGTDNTGTGTNITVTKPSAVAAGDLLVVSIYHDTATINTVPSGWTHVISQLNTRASPDFYVRTYWKRASSEGSSWTWVASASVWWCAECAAYTGGLAAGDPLDGTATAFTEDSLSDNVVDLPSITTTVDGSMLVAACGNFDGKSWVSGTSPVTNERADGNGLCLYDGIKTSAGASGTISISMNPGDGNSIAGTMLALKPAGGAPVLAAVQHTTHIDLSW